MSEPHRISLSQPIAWTQKDIDGDVSLIRTFRATEGIRNARDVRLRMSSKLGLLSATLNQSPLEVGLNPSDWSLSVKDLLKPINTLELSWSQSQWDQVSVETRQGFSFLDNVCLEIFE